jgi:hypothetical protein
VQFIIRVFYQVSLVQELVVNVCHVMLLAKPGILLEAVRLVAHQ